MPKKKSTQFSNYKTYELEDGTKYLALNDNDAESYRKKVNERKQTTKNMV